MSKRLGNFLLSGRVARTPLHILRLENPGNANQMKPFVDPNLEPIDSPPFDDPAELCIHKSDIPKGCFEPNAAEAKPKHSELNPAGNDTFRQPSIRERIKQRIKPDFSVVDTDSKR